MNDDPNAELHGRLRAGLRQGSLPGAPDGLRERLARLPSEPGGSRLSTLFSGIRLAALASAAVVVIAFVLIVRALPGPAPIGSPGPSAVAIAPSPSAAPSASGAPATAPPTSTPSVGPSDEPSGLGGFTCGTSATILPPTASQANPATQINDVRVGSHPGYDRIVFQFVGSSRPQLTVAVARPPFVGDATGKTIDVAGSAFLSLKLYVASEYPTYTGPSSFSPGYPALKALVNTGDYEGYVTWIAGLNSSACYRISTLSGPTRIVVDIQAP